MSDLRSQMATRMRRNYFNADARRLPNFEDTLSKCVQRATEVLEALPDGPIEYADMNVIGVDGATLEGLMATGRISGETESRMHARFARFHEALAAAMGDAPETATLSEVLTEDQAQQIWNRTA
jgi:hypothetical protein